MTQALKDPGVLTVKCPGCERIVPVVQVGERKLLPNGKAVRTLEVTPHTVVALVWVRDSQGPAPQGNWEFACPWSGARAQQ